MRQRTFILLLLLLIIIIIIVIIIIIIQYLNNTLANRSNAVKWGLSNNYECTLCTNTQTLGHVIGGCSVTREMVQLEKRFDPTRYCELSVQN